MVLWQLRLGPKFSSYPVCSVMILLSSNMHASYTGKLYVGWFEVFLSSYSIDKSQTDCQLTIPRSSQFLSISNPKMLFNVHNRATKLHNAQYLFPAARHYARQKCGKFYLLPDVACSLLIKLFIIGLTDMNRVDFISRLWCCSLWSIRLLHRVQQTTYPLFFLRRIHFHRIGIFALAKWNSSRSL